MDKTRIAVLVSGGGTNLQALIDAQNSGVLKSGEIVLVISNNSIAYALTRAQNAGIEALCISKKDCGSQEAFEEAILSALKERDIDLIVLAGFMSILSAVSSFIYDRFFRDIFIPIVFRNYISNCFHRFFTQTNTISSDIGNKS